MRLDQFWYELSVWSQQTFGSDEVRGPEGPLKHLVKEVLCEILGDDRTEVDNYLSCPGPNDKNLHDLGEYADLLFLVFDATRRAGFTYEQLCKAVEDKLAVNKARKWSAPSATDPVEHVRE